MTEVTLISFSRNLVALGKPRRKLEKFLRSSRIAIFSGFISREISAWRRKKFSCSDIPGVGETGVPLKSSRHCLNIQGFLIAARPIITPSKLPSFSFAISAEVTSPFPITGMFRLSFTS